MLLLMLIFAAMLPLPLTMIFLLRCFRFLFAADAAIADALPPCRADATGLPSATLIFFAADTLMPRHFTPCR